MKCLDLLRAGVHMSTWSQVDRDEYGALIKSKIITDTRICIYLGRIVMENHEPKVALGGCKTCIQEQIHICDVHGQCTRGRQFDGIHCCIGCTEKEFIEL